MAYGSAIPLLHLFAPCNNADQQKCLKHKRLSVICTTESAKHNCDFNRRLLQMWDIQNWLKQFTPKDLLRPLELECYTTTINTNICTRMYSFGGNTSQFKSFELHKI